METPACYSSHQPRQGGGPLSPRWPDVEPGDEDQGPSKRAKAGGGGVLPTRPGPGAAWSRACRWAGCRLPSPAPPQPSRPGPALPRPPPPAHKAPFTDSGSTSAAPEVWLTPLRKQTAPGPAGAAGHRGWILLLPAGGRTQTDLGSQQPWGEAGPGLLLGGGGRGSSRHLGNLGQHPCFWVLICTRRVVCRLNDTMLV